MDLLVCVAIVSWYQITCFHKAIKFCFVVQPFIKTPLDNTTIAINEGINRNFTCGATGYPIPTVMWYRTNGSFNDGVSMSKSIPTENASVVAYLTITNASRENTGVYTCTANNSIGIDSRSIRIICKYAIIY